MSRKTSVAELYTTIGAIVKAATGRDYWRKAGLQSRPLGVYATVYVSEGSGIELPVVESELIDPATPDEVYTQTPWGTTYLDVQVTFYKSDRASNDTANQAATRLAQALRLEERFWDIWEIAGLVGGVRRIDISGAFREDIEPRVEIRFSVVANIAEPPPLADKDIYDIEHQTVVVTHNSLDDVETTFSITENDPEEI